MSIKSPLNTCGIKRAYSLSLHDARTLAFLPSSPVNSGYSVVGYPIKRLGLCLVLREGIEPPTFAL